jgi:type II secretion system protein G
MRKALDEGRKDKGFTLIELLVVIIIIGILAAIAIPIFLHQRQKAVDASSKSDVRTVATQMETYYTDSQAYPVTGGGATGIVATTAGSVTTLAIGGENVTLSPGNTAHVYTNAGSSTPATAYCVSVSNTNATQVWVWESDKGGLQPSAVTSCPSSGTGAVYTSTVL